MASIEIASTKSHTDFDDLLNRIEQFDKPALLHLADIVNGLVYKKHQQGTYESQLLRKIKNNIPPSIKKRQRELYAQMQNNQISVPEKDELMVLNGLIEQKTAEKIMLMGELAKLRGITLPELNHQLNPQTHYA
jgi:hypothetical protein